MRCESCKERERRHDSSAINLVSLLEADARITELIIDNLNDQEVLLEL